MIHQIDYIEIESQLRRRHPNLSRFTLRLVLDRSGFTLLSIRNSSPIPGDPYLGLGPIGKRLLALAKLSVYGIAQVTAIVSRGRWLIGPSLEVWGRRGKNREG